MAEASRDAAKWMEELDSNPVLYPPGKNLTTSDNFFNFDEDALNILDMEKLDDVAEQWKAEAHKKMKKKKREVQEIKPEDITETIGGTVMSERNRAFGSEMPPLPIQRSLPVLVNKDIHPVQPVSGMSLPTSQQDSTVSSALHSSQYAHISTWHIPTVKETINRILVGERYVLEWYKSLEDKTSLLKEAISTHDGNTIITIILFLRSSLSKGLFEALLMSFNEAAQHYCSFLKQNAAWDQLKSVYYVQGEQRYVMLQYQLALSQESIKTRINALDSCRKLFKDGSPLDKEKYYVEEYLNLLKRQQKMEIVRVNLPVSSINRFQSVPLVDSTMITSLMYCCRFHLTDENPDVNPEEFKKDFQISDKQYFVVLLGSLCAKRDWGSIEKLLTPKSWQTKLGFGGKVKAPISLERLIRIIGKKTYFASEEFLSKYIRQVDDLETRLQLATNYHCYGLGIEILKQMKDIERLKAFVDQIPDDKQRLYRPAIMKLFS